MNNPTTNEGLLHTGLERLVQYAEGRWHDLFYGMWAISEDPESLDTEFLKQLSRDLMGYSKTFMNVTAGYKVCIALQSVVVDMLELDRNVVRLQEVIVEYDKVFPERGA